MSDAYRVTQQWMNEHITWKRKDPEWTAHARSVMKALYDMFLNAIVKFSKTIPRDGED